ncbi:MAG: hypothetical protein ACI9FN_004098 [Saprospiraceae bacterium]|jgi:hypothetical protein
MKYLFGTFILIMLASCSSDPDVFDDYNPAENNYSRHEFSIAKDATLIIRGDDLNDDMIEIIKEQYTIAHLGIKFNDQSPKENQEKQIGEWQNAGFVQVPNTRGSYYWKHVDVNKVTRQSYATISLDIDSNITSYDVLYHRVSRRTGIKNFELPLSLVESKVYGVRANLYGHSTKIYIRDELLQSELRCIDQPFCTYSFANFPEWIVVGK